MQASIMLLLKQAMNSGQNPTDSEMEAKVAASLSYPGVLGLHAQPYAPVWERELNTVHSLRPPIDCFSRWLILNPLECAL